MRFDFYINNRPHLMEPDKMPETKPYTYLIGWPQLNTWYYGVRYCKGCRPSDLWTKYFTSSNRVKKFRVEHGEPDVIEIRKTFTDAESARLWEHKVLVRMGIKRDFRFLNSHDMIGFPIMKGDANPAKMLEVRARLSKLKVGSSLGDESRTKISDTKIRANIYKLFMNRKNLEIKRCKIRKIEKYIAWVSSAPRSYSRILKWLNEYLQKCKDVPLKPYPKNRKSSRGRKMPSISLYKSGRKWYHDPITLKTSTFIEGEQPKGWVKGMIKRTPNNNENPATRKKLSVAHVLVRANESDTQKNRRLEKYHATIRARRERKQGKVNQTDRDCEGC